MQNKELLEALKALLEADKPKEILVDENSAEYKEKQQKKVEDFDEYHHQELREMPLEMLDGTTSTVYEEAKKSWLSPFGLKQIKNSR